MPPPAAASLLIVAADLCWSSTESSPLSHPLLDLHDTREPCACSMLPTLTPPLAVLFRRRHLVNPDTLPPPRAPPLRLAQGGIGQAWASWPTRGSRWRLSQPPSPLTYLWTCRARWASADPQHWPHYRKSHRKATEKLQEGSQKIEFAGNCQIFAKFIPLDQIQVPNSSPEMCSQTLIITNCWRRKV